MKTAILFGMLVFTHVYSYSQTNNADDSLLVKKDTAELIFCGGVENDLPVGVSNRFFRDTSSNGYIYAYYSQPAQLMIKQVMVEILPDNASDLGDRKMFNVKPKWKYTFIKCIFPGQGNYSVTLYDVSNNILAKGSITILDKSR